MINRIVEEGDIIDHNGIKLIVEKQSPNRFCQGCVFYQPMDNVTCICPKGLLCVNVKTAEQYVFKRALIYK